MMCRKMFVLQRRHGGEQIIRRVAIWGVPMRLFDMRLLNIQLGLAVVLAAVITLAVRTTVFGDDCNLFVVGVTFLLAFGVCHGGMWLIGRSHT